MSRLNLFITALGVLLLLSGSTAVLAQSPDIATVTNGIYDVFVQSTGSDKGTYTIRTGANHPVTLSMGSAQSVLYGGDSGSPGTSFNTIRSYTSSTDYVIGTGKSSDFAVINLDNYMTGTAAIGTNELQTTWNLPGPPATPDKLQILQSIRIQGNDFSNSFIVVSISVTNLGANPVSLGVRYFWDMEIGNDDGPTFTQVNQDGTIGAALINEVEFHLPAFESFHIQDNDKNPNPPIFGVHGTVTGPQSFLPSAPGILQFVCWDIGFDTAFNYAVDPSMNIATTAALCGGSRGGDSAISYLFGSDAASAYTISTQQILTLSTSIFAAPPDGDLDGDGLLNSWETNDTDLNDDGVIDVGPSVGSDPIKKDIYIEVDWMEAEGHLYSHQPWPEAIEKVVDAFAAHDINLHVDVGPNSIDYVTGNTWGQNSNGNEFPHEDVIGHGGIADVLANDWERLRDANFGHSDRVYRHALFVHRAKDPDVGPSDNLLGMALPVEPPPADGNVFDQYFFVSLGSEFGGTGSVKVQAATFMHELGHTLGLRHGGNDGLNNKPNYLSVMNYNFNTSGLIINGTDGHMDYSRFDLPDLTETTLLESDGLNDTRVSGYKTKYYADGICNLGGIVEIWYIATPADQPIDWNCNGQIDSQAVSNENINGDSGISTLTSWDDWSNLNFKAGNMGLAVAGDLSPITGEALANGPKELTFEEDLRIQRISDPRVQLTETASVSSVQAGGFISYTVTMLNIDAQNANDVVLTETLPAGFNYVPGSTSGATTTNPIIDGQNLSWSPFTVPANGGVLTLSFQVTASQIPGIYSNSMSGSSTNGYVVAAESPAEVEVVSTPTFTPTNTATSTATATNTFTPTPTATATQSATTITIQPNASTGLDAYISSSKTTTNYGTATGMGIGEDNSAINVTRSLIKFDLSAIPANATINSAVLSLWTSTDLSSNDRTLRVYRLKTAWNESQVTWQKAANGANWQTAGASGANDRESTDIGSITLLNNEALNTEKQISLNASKIQEMRNGTFTNNGFILVTETENNDRFDYKTSDHATSSQWPKLVIQYTLPPATNTPTFTPTFTPTATATPSPTGTMSQTPTSTFTPLPPGVIFADGFESGDLSRWYWADTNGGNLSVSTQAAAVGTKGMQAFITDSGGAPSENTVINVLDESDPFYFNPNSAHTPHGLENLLNGLEPMNVYDHTPQDETHYSARFYLDPNSVDLPNGEGLYLFSGSDEHWVLCLYMQRQGNYYRLSLCGEDDALNWIENRFVYITDAWQAIEIEWQAASAPGANNGYMKLFVNDVLMDHIQNLDTDQRLITYVGLGVDGIPTGTTGTVYFDAFESRRASHIGLEANGPSLPTPLTDLIFLDAFESGDFSSWNAVFTGGGDLSVSASAAHQGAYGMQALVNDTGGIRVYDEAATQETQYHARFYFHPHSLVMTSGDAHTIFEGADAAYNTLFGVLLNSSSGNYQLQFRLKNDADAYVTSGLYTLSNTWHAIEIEWQASSTALASDGFLTLWIDGNMAGTLSGIDIDTHALDNVSLGAVNSLDAGTSGTMWFDEFESRRSSYIGP